MKKIISLAVVVIMIIMAVTACSAKEKEYTLCIGSAVEANVNSLKVTETVAAVVLDAEGKIVLCRIDSTDSKATITDGAVDAKVFESKMELGDKYGMLSDYGSKLAEWDDQTKAFETAVVGKTMAEVLGMKGGEGELEAKCTIDVAPFVKALEAATKSEHKATFKTKDEFTLGVSMDASLKDKAGDASYVCNMSAVVLSGDTVAAALVDSRDGTLDIEDGAGVEYKTEGTKLELGDKYGMVQYGKASAEWYVQATTYASEAVGKTKTELSSLATENVAGCTIDVKDYKAVIMLAAEYAR